MLETVAAYLEPGPSDRLLDAYCGVGLFGLALADRVAQVVGIEAAPSAALDFMWNAEAKGLENAMLIEGPVDEALAAWAAAAEASPEQATESQPSPPEGFGEGIDLVVAEPKFLARTIKAKELRPRDITIMGEIGPSPCTIVQKGHGGRNVLYLEGTYHQKDLALFHKPHFPQLS